MNEALYYNAVAEHFGGDRIRLRKLYSQFLSWEESYRSVFGSNEAMASTAWKKLAASGVRLVMANDGDYPPPFKEMADPPFGIYALGSLPPLSYSPPPSLPALLAVVGTRRATPDGKNTARRFACELAAAGFAIVSGLAFGIDAAAHEGCLEAGGITLSVLANGLGSIYPHSNKKLAERILAAGGAIISEYPLDAPPFQSRFLERNRLISGISRGVLIVEAPEHSGSLATARLAMEENRDVFVVPGAVSARNFFGSHELIRQGATLVTRTEHILDAYGISKKGKLAVALAAASPEEMLVLKALVKLAAPADVDKIIALTKLEPRIVNRTLAFLLAKNHIKEINTGYTIEGK